MVSEESYCDYCDELKWIRFICECGKCICEECIENLCIDYEYCINCT